MKHPRTLLVAAVVIALLAIPAVATAQVAGLLTNEYGQEFAGRAVCMGCHGVSYDQTTHGRFAKTDGAIEPTAGAEGMWPAGRISGGQVLQFTDLAFVLGDGSGVREFIVWNPTMAPVQVETGGVLTTATATGPFAIVEGLEWNPASPDVWEYTDTRGLWYTHYRCSQCHMLGAVRFGVKPNAAANSNGATGTMDVWAKHPEDPTTTLSSWVPGSSIQCERCHGTGIAATSTANGEHFNSGVRIVGYHSPAAWSSKVLMSETCGQCHGSFKTGNLIGFTPDTTLQAYVTQYTPADVPSEASFTANPGAYRFFPSGHNKGLKHVYFTEWALSAHSVRSALATSSPIASPYQKTGASHFSNTTSILCNRCHTGEGFLNRKGDPMFDSFVETTTNEGFLGQECAVCHIPHNADTSTGMEVRPPDPANGQYSTKGLNIANQSMCEDCHNWQAEIIGTPITPSTTGRGPSHPQREAYHGRLFFEVPTSAELAAQGVFDSADFMPGAKCEHCHMPATRTDFPGQTVEERYGDRSFKRFSHRMLVMEPGDAEAWGLEVGQDSCSQCHPGATRAMLQDNIDSWQSAAASLDASLRAAITAANGRAEATGAGQYLVAVAYTNEKGFQNDASGGAHNPPYIQMALRKSISIAKSVGGSFSIVKAGGTSATPGTRNFVAGTILNGDGSPAADATLTLQASTGAGFSDAGTAKSDANGNFVFMVAPTDETDYRVVWMRSSNASTFLTSPVVTIAVGGEVKATTTITIASNTYRVLLGRVFVLSGVVAPLNAPDGMDTLIGKIVRVDVIRPGSARWSYSSNRVIYLSAGQALWQYKYRPLLRGTYRFRASFAGNDDWLPATSRTISVSVR